MLMVRQTLVGQRLRARASRPSGVFSRVSTSSVISMAYYISVVWFLGLGIGGIINKLTLGEGGC